MFLKSVELFGFKSFADRTRFEFSDGITALLGPNGSGKSNVVDSIKWVLGTQALSTIRANKRDDVIFNGTDKRKPMQMCEVILTLNNEEGLLKNAATEVEIKRRLFRDGNNEYYINREKRLYREIKELFMDTGVGKAAYSILEQGKIDQILLMKSEDRRYIFEEAAGISSIKQEREDAERKLEKTEENLAQVSILLNEAERTYISRKNQLDKVLKHRELSARKEKLEVDVQLSYLQSLTKLKDFRQAELDKLNEEQLTIDAVLSNARDGLEAKKIELEELRRQREEVSGRYHAFEERINSFNKSIDIYNERYQDIAARSKAAKDKALEVQARIERDKARLDERKAEYESMLDNIRLSNDSLLKMNDDIEHLKSDKIRHKLDIDDLQIENEKISEDRINITNQISQLANDIADKLEREIQGSGYSSTVRSKAEKELFRELSKARTILQERMNFLSEMLTINFEKDVYSSELEKTFEALMEELDEIKGLFQEYSGTIPTFLDDFTAPDGTLSKKADLDKALEDSYEKERSNRNRISELEAEINRLEGLLILKESDKKDIEMDIVQFKARADSLKNSISEIKETLQQMEFDFSDASHNVQAEESKVNETLEAIDNLKAQKQETVHIISSLKDNVNELTLQIEKITNEIFENNAQFQDKFNRKQQLSIDIATASENIKAIMENIQKLFTDFFENTGKSLKEFNDHEITAPLEELKTELEQVKKRIQDLGYINYMAEEEYTEAKKNFDFYSTNMEDLTKAKEQLVEVSENIKQQCETMFLETYNQISNNFMEMFTTLFGGGKAQLILTDEENLLSTGIDIKAQPPGKPMLQLGALSGGERSMTAMALLFATYMVKPSPFCILDEIDAALDARNVGAFMRVLDKFEEKSQFIIITHNKGTAMGSDSLLGVTQQEAGVSKMIGYRLEDVKDLAKEHDTLKG